MLAGFLLALFLANALSGVLLNSGVADELGAHLPSGYLYLSSGRFGGGISNFPLGQVLIALPVRLLGLPYELFTEQHLVLFRLPVVLMGVLLGVLIYRWGCLLYGHKAGIAALALFALSPNALAHASLATLDLPTAWFVFLTAYSLHRYVKEPRVSRLLVFSLAIAGATVIKIQALLLAPMAIIIFVVSLRRIMPAGRRDRVALGVSWLLVPVTVFVVVNVVYLHLPWLTGNWLPAQFVNGLGEKLLHSGGGHFAYLMGRYSQEGWWYYFPVALLLKTPLPTLALLVAGLGGKPRRDPVVFLWLPIVVFLGAAMSSSVNIGLRHVLMIYPFLFLIAGCGASKLWATVCGKGVVVALATWYVAQAVLITPHHLSFFNVLVGGARNGHRYLIDSNYDWGQNDHFLRRYVEEAGFAYQIDPDAFQPTTGHILINVNARYGLINGGPAAYAWLAPFDPINQIAYTWFEYDIPEQAFPAPLDDGPLRAAALADLLEARERCVHVADAHFRQSLALGFVVLDAYDLALEELRWILARQPGFEPALRLGGELTVRRKLGVLRFRGAEYLTGFRTERPTDTGRVERAEVLEWARQVGAGPRLSEAYNNVGVAMLRQDDWPTAGDAFRRATALDPLNELARANLEYVVQNRPDAGHRDRP